MCEKFDQHYCYHALKLFSTLNCELINTKDPHEEEFTSYSQQTLQGLKQQNLHDYTTNVLGQHFLKNSDSTYLFVLSETHSPTWE